MIRNRWKWVIWNRWKLVIGNRWEWVIRNRWTWVIWNRWEWVIRNRWEWVIWNRWVCVMRNRWEWVCLDDTAVKLGGWEQVGMGVVWQHRWDQQSSLVIRIIFLLLLFHSSHCVSRVQMLLCFSSPLSQFTPAHKWNTMRLVLVISCHHCPFQSGKGAMSGSGPSSGATCSPCWPRCKQKVRPRQRCLLCRAALVSLAVSWVMCTDIRFFCQ